MVPGSAASLGGMRAALRHLSIRNLGLAVGAAVLLGGAGFTAVYFAFFNPRPVATVSLPSPVPVVSASPGTGAGAGVVAVTWRVGTGSFVGYRVREQLADVPAPSDAVGRSSVVSGSLAITTNPDGGATVTGINVTADLTHLQSDSARRDGYVGRNYLETGRFPTATFVRSASLAIPAAVMSGTAGQVTATGQLTIHGVTRDVSINLKVQRSGAVINVVASYGLHWGDFGVQQPQTPFASIQGDPTIEISLVLAST
jgi:polyisoprenoid-binding protein YceI